MKRAIIKDRYNQYKEWIVIKSDCSHYFLNQMVMGKTLYKPVRTTIKNVLDTLNITKEELDSKLA